MPDSTDAAPAAIEARKDAWRRTLQELESLGAEREEEGWNVIAIPVGHAAPEPPDAGDDDRFGFVHVIPGNYESAFRDAFEASGFERYNVYRQAVGGQVFFILELLDAATEKAILLAAQFSTHHGQELESVVAEEGVVYTHVQKLDGTHLGTYQHDEPDRFFPE
jgi:hypothetical protein